MQLAMAVGMRGLLVLTLGLAMAATSSAAIYKVGDAAGWTILGNINYTDWTTKKTFHVGDIVGKFSLLSLKFNSTAVAAIMHNFLRVPSLCVISVVVAAARTHFLASCSFATSLQQLMVRCSISVRQRLQIL